MSVCEGERKIIFSNLLPLPPPCRRRRCYSSFLCFSLKLPGLVKHFFFLLLRKMETLRLLSPGREAAKDFAFLLRSCLDLPSSTTSDIL